jgi:Ribonuclease G/E
VIRLAVSPGERRVAVCGAAGLLAARVERPARPEGVGDLHVGRVTAVARALSGCFVATVDGDGFLPFDALPERRPPPEGAAVRVRIVRAPQGGKGARLALVAGEAVGPPRLLVRGPDAVTRFAERFPDAAIEVDDAAEAARLRPRFGARLRVVAAPAFDEPTDSAFAALSEPSIALPGGIALSIHPTPALVAIDIDAGPTAPAESNAAALAEAARQIALRELSGAILIDAAGLRPKARAALLPGLAALLDPTARLLGLTPGGLLEIRRARVWAPWHEVTGMPPSALTRGLAALRRALAEARARPGARLALVAAPAVIAALDTMPEALAEYAERAAHPIVLRADPAALGESIEDA